MAAIAVGVTLLCLWSHGEGEAYDKRLATEGRTTTGRITEVWEHWARGGRSYTARYEYFVRGKRYELSK